MIIALGRNTILKGKYNIEDSIRAIDNYIEYKAVDLAIKEEVIIREYYPENDCSRNLNQSNAVFIREGRNNDFIQGMNGFMSGAEKLAKGSSGYSVRDYFYENNTGYVVFSAFEQTEAAVEEKKKTPIIILEILLIAALLVFTILLLKEQGIIFARTGDTGVQNGSSQKSSSTEENNKKEEEKAEPEEDEEVIEDISEEEYLNMYDGADGLYIRDYVYDDFDGDGVHEIFMTKSATKGWKEKAENYEELDTDTAEDLLSEDYSVWYADNDGIEKLDSFFTTDEWNKALYTGFVEIAFGSYKQVLLSGGSYYGDRAGYITDTPCQVIYGADTDGAYVIQRFDDAIIEFKDGILYIEEAEYTNFPVPRTGFPAWIGYPLLFTSGKYTELASCEVNKGVLDYIDGWDTVNKQIINILQTEGYENGLYGSLATEVEMNSISLDSVLYNDNGKIYVNYSAEGYDHYSEVPLNGDYKLTFEAEMDIKGNKVSNVHVMAGNRKTSYFGVENAVVSDVSSLYKELGIKESDIKDVKEINRVFLTIMGVDQFMIQGNAVFITGDIHYTDVQKTFIIDDNTKLTVDPQYLNKYNQGMSGFSWITNVIITSDNYFQDLYGVYELWVKDGYVTDISGLYWWD